MKKKIDILCRDGSPLKVTEASIWGRDGRVGVGGAELALLTMCRGWHDRGYDVTLYNNPDNPENSVFRQRTVNEFDPDDDRDALIVFRSPNPLALKARGLKVWWSCDQFTIDDYKVFSKQVDKIVTISPFHSAYFKTMYGIDNSVSIDLPVRVQDYKGNVEKISKRCIFTSIPDRGVMQLHAAWALIVRDVPDASLVITSDWRLWDAEIDKSVIQPYQLAYARQPNVSYMGAVKRDKLIGVQLEADVHLYPCVYEELFGISVAESQVAGAVPITSQIGAVKTTNSFGIQIPGSPYEPKFIETFVKAAVDTLSDPYLKDIQEDMKAKARERFSLDRILTEWEEKIFQ